MHKNNFDFLRLLFASMVVFAHIFELTKGQNTFPFLSHLDSFLPVAGFFIISGFLIGRSYDRSKSLADYFSKRAKRLLPGYVLIILVTAILLVFVSTFDFSTYFGSPMLFKFLAGNLIFLNFIEPCLPGVFLHNEMCAINGSLWTIKVEVGFYIIVPVLAFLIRKFNRPLLFLLVLYVLVLIHNYLLERYLAVRSPGMYFTLSHQLPALMTYFISGMILHYYFDFLFKNKAIVAAIAFPIFLMEYFYNYHYLQPITLALVLFYFAYSSRFKMFNNVGKHGDFSYGIYIYHFPLIQLFVFWGMFNADHNRWTSMILLLTIVAIIAWVSWNFVEKRFLKSRTVSAAAVSLKS
jgi:peptidoglycan/LPS O-acetylase OafA/YrhL